MWPFRNKAATTASEHTVTGRRGEKLAKKHIKRAGLKVLGTNYNCPVGEADIVALDQKAQQLVIVEVKTRTSEEYTSPLSAITKDKKRRLRNIAKYYLSTHKKYNLDVRFDVISIVMAPNKPVKLEHIPSAF